MMKEVWHIGIVLIMIVSSTPLVFAMGTDGDNAQDNISHDTLQDIFSKGSLVLAVKPEGYTVINGSVRDPNSHCTGIQYSANQLSGDLMDVNSRIAKELGVDSCFVTVTDEELQRGNWTDKWDYFLDFYMTDERMQWLYFAQPWASSNSVFFIRADNNDISTLKDLSGKRIGTYNQSAQMDYLNHNLSIPGIISENPINNPIIVGYSLEAEAMDDLMAGKIDAVLFPDYSVITNQSYSTWVKQLTPYAFIGFAGPAIAKSDARDPVPFVNRLNEIIRKLHNEGELSNISITYWDYDLTKDAAEFNLSSLHQFNESA